MSLREWTIKNFARESVSDDLRSLAYVLAAFSFIWLTLSILLSLFASGWVMPAIFAVFGAGTGVLYHTMWQDQVVITANPKMAAILKIWGKRVAIVLHEGIVMIFRRWPFNIDIEPVEAWDQEFDFVFPNISCGTHIDEDTDSGTVGEKKDDDTADKAEDEDTAALKPKRKRVGGSVHVQVSGAFAANIDEPEETIRFQDYGGIAGVVLVLEEIFEDSVNDAAGHFDWESFRQSRSAVKVLLLSRIGGMSFKRLRESGQPLPEGARNMTPQEYQDISDSHIVDPHEYLFREKVNDEERKRREQEVEVYLKVLGGDNLSDVHGMGTKISKLNVIIRPNDTLQAEANAAAAEDTQRRREAQDTRTKIALARSIANASKGTVTFDQAHQRLLVADGRAKMLIVEAGGADALTKAAAIMTSNT